MSVPEAPATGSGNSRDETARLEALRRYDILDTPREHDFDEVAELASEICETPIAVLNLIGDGRQFFKAEVGLGVRETPFDSSFCAKAILEEDFLVVPDATKDLRFAGNPLVVGEPGLRFYAGALLRTDDGHPIGTVCVLDYKPRELTALQEKTLRVLARQVMRQLELRRALTQQDVSVRRSHESDIWHRQVLDSAIDYGIITMDLDGTVNTWNAGAEAILGWSEEEMRGKPADVFFTPEDVAAHIPEQEMESARERGRGNDERWHIRKDGTRFYALGEMMPLTSAEGEQVGYLKILRDRTQQREAEDHSRRVEGALVVSEERMRLAVEATGIGIFDFLPATGSLRWDPRVRELFGVGPEAPVTYEASFLAGLHPEDRDWVDAAVRAAIDPVGSGRFNIEYRVRSLSDGTERWLAAQGQSTFDGDQPVRFVGTVRDVTRRRRAIEDLARSEERFRTILETVEAAFAIVQVRYNSNDEPIDYRFLEANPAFERQAGVDLRGKWVTEFAPDLERFWFETYGRVAKNREPATFENYAEAFKRWFDVRAVPVGDPADRQLAIIFSDTTARRDAEERLRASEALARENIERVQLALEAGAIIGTWHWDLPTDRFTIDEAFARSFGLDPALGREGIPLAQIVATVHPDDQAGLAAAIDDAIQRGGRYAHQYRTRRADGRYYWLEANGRVDHGADGTPLSFPGVLIDVEERRAVEQERDRAIAELRVLTETLEQRVSERTAELLNAEEQLRQSQKMEAVGQLTGGLAHDFNNLLAGISGSLEMMGNRISQGRLKDIDKYMVAAQGATKRAAALTHRLLAFSRRQTLAPKATDVNAMIDGMLDLIQRTVGPSVHVEMVGLAKLWPTLVDPSQLENALLNLCINARDAMPSGGRVVIETANRWIDIAAARRQDMPEGEYLSLSVSDNGTGMPPEVIAKAFDPFFTTKPLGQGTGLGLSMIYGFAKQSGGQVRIHSEEGRGTTVSIYLPRYRGKAESDEAPQAAGLHPVAKAGETVLIVDDEPTVRMLVTDVLRDLGYTAVEAADGAGGLKVLQSDARIDLLITDVGLPGGLNGRQMADAARVSRPDLMVLFITGFAENALLSGGQLEAGMSVLTKPFAVDALAARIHELIAR